MLKHRQTTSQSFSSTDLSLSIKIFVCTEKVWGLKCQDTVWGLISWFSGFGHWSLPLATLPHLLLCFSCEICISSALTDRSRYFWNLAQTCQHLATLSTPRCLQCDACHLHRCLPPWRSVSDNFSHICSVNIHIPAVPVFRSPPSWEKIYVHLDTTPKVRDQARRRMRRDISKCLLRAEC